MPPTMDKWIARVLAEVGSEVKRANAKHAPMNSAHEAYAVLLEEVDEFKEQVWKQQKNRDLEEMRNELIQVAAMAVRAICDLNLAEAGPCPARLLARQIEENPR